MTSKTNDVIGASFETMKKLSIICSLFLLTCVNTFPQPKPVKSPRIKTPIQQAVTVDKSNKDKAISLLTILDLNRDNSLSVEELSSASFIIKNLNENIKNTGKIDVNDIENAIASQAKHGKSSSNGPRPIAKKKSGGNTNAVSGSRPSLRRPSARKPSSRSARLSARKSSATRRVAQKSNVNKPKPQVPKTNEKNKDNKNLLPNKPSSVSRPNIRVNSLEARNSLTKDLKELRDRVKSGINNKTWDADKAKLETAANFLKNIQKYARSIRAGKGETIISEIEDVRKTLFN